MIIFGGDKVVPVLKLNDSVISSEKGPITGLIQDWYEATLE